MRHGAKISREIHAQREFMEAEKEQPTTIRLWLYRGFEIYKKMGFNASRLKILLIGIRSQK